jgi:hypothetical protein
VGVEPAIEVVLRLLDLFEDDLQLRIHGAERPTEASIVIMVDFVGF